MKIIKRNGQEAIFDEVKITNAIIGANKEVVETERLSEEEIDNITNIGSTIEAGTGGKITAKEINNINGGVTLKRVQVGEVETIKDEVTVNDYPGEKFTIKDPKIYHLLIH